MTHLTPSLDLDAATLAHLDAGCPRCEALLDGIDLRDLARLVEASEAPAAVSAADRDALWRRIRPRRLAAGFTALLVAAAALLAIVTVDPWDGVKGTGAPPAVSLRVVAAHDGPAGLVLDGRVEDAVDRSATLLFEIETDRPASRALFAIDGAGTVIRLWPPGEPAIEPAGPRRLMAGDSWVALDVGDLRSPLTLIATASDEPIAVDPRDPPDGAATMTVEIR